ncbi:toprim domain-containing protein [Streptomyces halobius]|uniref:Toprim domain-containing protein n=1 Tax=Streptomyces halobius TaxID=2879846 RepID=A0ABY4M1M9_9ACTN|nr:toprim domain-containing protein [Streptomyces halobius]UQA91620.1 toprim domain-containing protein [Streptomyces halobius]
MQTLSAEQRRFFEQAVSTYQSNLTSDTSVQAYLMGRGFGPAEAATFRLGVVRRHLVGHEGFAGRLAIPYLTPTGVVNIRFRCLRQHDCASEDCPKYLGMDGAENRLYNVLDLKKPGRAICVAEGELDAATLSMAGLPAVGVPGVESWQDHWGRCLEDFDQIYTFADGDKAGRRFAKFLAKEVRARPVRIPAGEDCNSIYVKEGPNGLRKLISE